MALDFIKYIGPGLLVTVGFIDPGNWASNVSAGARFWLYSTLDGNPFNYYANCSST